MKIPLKDILIGERQRLDLGDLSDLDTMAELDVGQIVPIVVHKTLQGYELVDGRRRLAKATALNWPTIEAYEKDQLTPVQKQMCEFFADIGRKDRTWQERCLAVAKIHRMRQREKAINGEDWTIKQTAAFIQNGHTSTKNLLYVAKALEVEPRDEPIWSSEGFMKAFHVLLSRQEEETRSHLERRRQLMAQEQQPVLLKEVESNGEYDTKATPNDSPSLGQQLTSTEDAPLKVFIRGYNIDFSKAVLDEHFLGASFDGAIGFSRSMADLSMNVMLALKPNANLAYFIGIIEANKAFIINAIVPKLVPPDYTILCFEGVPPVDIVMTGRIPVFFEADPEAFKAKVDALRAYYQETISNVEIIEV